MEEKLDQLINTGQRIQSVSVSSAAFWRWRRAVLETLGSFDPMREDFSKRCNTPEAAHIRNGLEVLRSAKAAFATDRWRSSSPHQTGNN